MMKIIFERKFSEQQMDIFIDKFYNNYREQPNDNYQFDLTETEWISNQGLLLLSGLLKYFIEKGIVFEVVFIKKGISTNEIPKRVAIQIVQIWKTWGLWKIIPNYEYRKYLGIDDNTIRSLIKLHGINLTRPEIYDRYGITPFMCLNNIKNYDDSIIIERLKKYHALNKATIDIVEKNNCDHPFVNDLFGEIISREIYENYLSHSGETFFKSEQNFAFLSLALKGKIDEKFNDESQIQKILKLNFISEELTESKGFFYDSTTHKYTNQSYISYSFLDFGIGIVESLRPEFRKHLRGGINESDDEILKFAFRHNSSRHPIRNVFDKVHLKDFIPRGLFDVLSLVLRYDGLLIVRSCYGKVLFDFSDTQDFEDAFSLFGDNKIFFPGTFITIYLPAISTGKKINTSVIKPIYELPNYSSRKAKYISLYSLVNKAKSKDIRDIYTFLFDEILRKLKNKENTLLYFSFEHISDKQLIKKIIFYFVSNYDINVDKNIVIIYPPNVKFLEEINYEISNLSVVNQDYKIHPLPFIYYEKESNDINLKWLGIYDENDIKKLNELLYEQFSLVRSDFNEPNNLIGHLNYFDKFGNFKSNFPNREEILFFYEKSVLFSKISEVKKSIEENCISKLEDSIYFCNGNYYQFEYLELTNLLNNHESCLKLSNILFDVFRNYIDEENSAKEEEEEKEEEIFKFIAITSSSHRILDSLEKQGRIKEEDIILIDNYHDLSDLKKKISNDCQKVNYIFVCDCIATGDVIERTDSILKGQNCKLKNIVVIANTIDPDFKPSQSFFNTYEDQIIYLYNYPIKKYLRKSVEIKDYLLESKIVRISPYTNIPIGLSLEDTNPNNIILTKEEFLSFVEDEYINIKLLKFNNIIHPYFFNMEKIVKEKGVSILEKIFTKNISGTQKRIINIESENLKIFYPKNSDIKYLDFVSFKSNVLKDHSISEYELERYGTEDGWKFPHTSERFKAIIGGNPVLLLDDGTCSGDSLTQMINEISFFNPKKITVLSLIGRVDEHKREFLSLVNSIKKDNKKINVDIYFGTHWHIPTYYLDQNPNYKERNWLNQLTNIPNTPSRIKKIILSIYESLEPVDQSETRDHKFLPKTKQKQVLKKELIGVRDEIGKVIGYRFYKESFTFFNDFIKRYLDSEITDNRYRDVELLCAAISYEPYIFDRIRHILPDITEKLKEFIKVIIFGNSKKTKSKLKLSALTFKWNSRDFIHLFFIFYSENEVFTILNDKHYFSELLIFVNDSRIQIDYVLYKILTFLPINRSETGSKNTKIISTILKTLIQRGDVKEDSKRQIKVFLSFILTLPTDESFEVQRDNIALHYEEQKSKILHDKKATFNHHISSLIGGLRKMRFDLNNNNQIHNRELTDSQNYWNRITEFLNPILRFSFKYGEFLKPYPYDELYNRTNDELRKVISKIDNILFPINNNSLGVDKILDVEKSIVKLQKDFEIGSDIHILFSENEINLYSLIRSLLSELSKVHPKLNYNEFIIRDDIKVNIPQLFAQNLILKELSDNVRNYSDKTNILNVKIKTVNIEEEKIDKYITLVIENAVSKELNLGSGIGLDSLSKLSDSKCFNFQYKPSNKKIGDVTYFVQKLTFIY